MRILFLSPGFFPKIGGVEKHVLEVAVRLKRKGHEITVITEAWDSFTAFGNIRKSGQASGYKSEKLEKKVKSVYFDTYFVDGVKVVSFRFGNKGFFKKIRIWFLLFKVFAEFKTADIIHCHDVFIWYLLMKFILPWKKVFTTFHGYESYPIKKKAIIIRKISETLSIGSICVGDFMTKWYNAKPDYVIYGGVNVLKQNKEGSNYSAFFWGRLDEQTNIIEYCKAVEKIKEKIPKFEFVIAGKGKFEKYSKKCGKLLGFIKNPEEKARDYQLAFVSRYLSILEALAAKKPIFALYDNPLKQDYLEMTPFRKYINILNNPQNLASSVQFYYSNKKIEQKKIEEGYAWAKKQTWDSVVLIYEKLWKKN